MLLLVDNGGGDVRVIDSDVGDRGVRVGDVGLAGKAGFSTIFSELDSVKKKILKFKRYS